MSEFGLAPRLPRRRGYAAAALVGALLAFRIAAASAAPAPITVQLNRLDDHDKSCRASFVIANPGPEAFAGFTLDLVIFDRSGTIQHRIAADVAPLRADKESVKVFDIPATACPAIGSILINDVLDCRTAAGPVADCVGRLAPSSKLPVKLLK